MADRLRGRVAAITGAGMGLGQAVAKLFASEGARVVVGEINVEKGQETVSRIKEQGGVALFVQMDVRLQVDAERLTQAAVEAFGRLDVLVNNVGVQINKDVVDTSEAEWDFVVDTNLKSMFLCSKYAVAQMRQQGGGNIICVSSLSGLVGNGLQASYNASKHGVIGLVRSMAVDHAADNIRINAVCPGSMNTPLTETIPEEKLAPYRNANLMKRFAEPIEVAQALLFLASDEASFVTGSVLVADGGFTTL
ncbi:MAG: glucose 1-dehydrogenase [Caldilineaceae bacterium]|nr:glucose 1-dehydrogenase [Caldilineaceae bacterium]